MSLAKNPNVGIAYNFFRSKNYSPQAAAGIVGNLLGESQLNPKVRPGDSGTANGIAQWRFDRWDNMKAKAREWKVDHNDFMAQLRFVDYELRTGHKRAYDQLMAARNVDEATAAFISYEKPQHWSWANPRAGHNYSGRLAYANDAFRLFGGSTNQPRNLTGSDAVPFDDKTPENSFTASQDAAVSPMDIQPNQPLTNPEVRELEADKEENRISMWEGMGEAIKRDWSWPNMQGNEDRIPDPNFRMNDDLMKELTKGVPEQYWGQFTDSVSEGHARAIRGRLDQAMESERKLASLGGTGIALRLAAGVTDPMAWAIGAGVTLATGGAGTAAYMGARFGKLGQIGYGAALGATANAGAEAVHYGGNPLGEASDIAMAAGMGLVLGGAFGSLAKNPSTLAEAEAIERIGREMQKGAIQPSSSAGAAQASPRETLRADTYDIVTDGAEAAPRAFGGKWTRFDLAGFLKNSNNMMTRMVGNVLVEDGARNSKGITPIGASEVQSHLNRKAQVKWRKAYDPALADYMKRNDMGWADRSKAHTEFSKEVTRFVRSSDPLEEFDPAVAKVGSAFREMMNDWRQQANNPGIIDGRVMKPVQGAGSLAEDANYVPRMFDLGSIRDKLDRFGHRNLSKLLAEGMAANARAAGRKVDMDKLDRFAAGYLKRLHSKSAGELLSDQRAFAGDDLENLKRLLGDSVDIDEADLDDILAMFKQRATDPADKTSQTGAVSQFKHRMMFDENFGAKITTRDGTGQEFVRISDLFVNDADTLMQTYSRQMSGRVALARMEVKNPKWTPDNGAPEFLIEGLTSDSDIRKLLDQVRAVGDETGVKPGATSKDIQSLEFAFDSILGRPHFNENTTFAKAARVTRDWNFTRVMGQVGFAQFPELANIAAQTGLKAMFTNMPSFRSMWRNARTGKLDDALAEEIEDLTTMGTDWLRNTTHNRVDDFENPFGGALDSKAGRWADAKLQSTKKAVSAISGLAPMNTMLQRVTGRAIFNKFAYMARKGEKVAGRRMQALGLDDAMLQRITGEINSNASWRKGKLGGDRLEAMNFGKWGDQEALAAFENAVSRLGRTIIQENDLGQMARWMSSPAMRSVLQFRSFMLSAWSKQFLQGLNFRDGTTAAAFSGSMFLASLGYMARTHLNAIGRSDRDEYLERRLSVGAIAGAGLQNSSWFTLFAPAGDMAGQLFLEEPLFMGRNTMLASDPLWGNPTFDLGDSLLKAGTAAVRGVTGQDFAQTDARAMQRVLPLQNVLGLSNLFSTLISPLPEWRPKD